MTRVHDTIDVDVYRHCVHRGESIIVPVPSGQTMTMFAGPTRKYTNLFVAVLKASMPIIVMQNKDT